MAQSGLQIGDYTIQRSLIGVLILDIQRPSRIKFWKIFENDLVRYGYNFVPRFSNPIYFKRRERFQWDYLKLWWSRTRSPEVKKSNRCRSDKWFNPHIEQTYDTDLPEGILFPYFCYFTLNLLESRYLVRSRLHPSFELKGFLWGSKGSIGFYGVLWEDSIG